MTGIYQSTAPTWLPITLEEAKLYLKLDDIDTDDDLVTTLIGAATNQAQNYTGRPIMQQGWTQTYEVFPSNAWLRMLPIKASTVEVKYFDTANDEQTLNDLLYRVYNLGTVTKIEFGSGLPQVYDRPDAVRVIYTAGYGSAATEVAAQALVPYDIKVAIKLYLGALYENREEKTLMKEGLQLTTAERILFPYRNNLV